ncbi:MAG: phytoene desaturase, partial [Pseudomonadota bacterium]
GSYFPDPRLRQLFGRYATYVGASPFSAPGVLMLIAHVEQTGVWLVDGGMTAVARAMEALGQQRGAHYRYGTRALRILVDRGSVVGVELADGERLAADAVVFNGDPAALATGLLGDAVSGSVGRANPRLRSLSAMTFAFKGRSAGRPLAHHTVAFSSAYQAEFDAIFGRGSMPTEPTVYICASDRGAGLAPRAPEGDERIFCLINAPPKGDDATAFDDREIEQCQDRTFSHLQRLGLAMNWEPRALTVTTPRDFHRRFPATGGALYGPVSHGWMASFQRPGSRTRLKGLYLAGGATHPGAGVPMATLSGRLAAQALSADLASMRSSRPVAMSGGMSTASATTDSTR